MQSLVSVKVAVQPSFKALAVRTSVDTSKSGTREAWRILEEQLQAGDPRRVHSDTAYVFIPQKEWAEGVQTLWVGLAVHEFGEVPPELEPLTIPETLCATVRVHGGEAHMNEAYDAMFWWLQESEEYELDTGQGVLGIEANRLSPVNPFVIPYSQMDLFDYDMLYPIRERRD